MSSSKRFRSFQSSCQRPWPQIWLPSAALLFALSSVLSGCVMGEEMKRISAQKRADQARQESGSSNLTGEQIFIRTCNTCHPGGQAGMGPTLENMAKDFPNDASLKAYIRHGKGIMPGQPKDVLNEQEMDNLIGYVRGLTFDK